MNTTNIGIKEQVNQLIINMKQLVENLNNTDTKNIDFEQLKEFSKFCLGYSIDIDCIIKIMNK